METPISATRSSLEEMLDSLRRRNEKPKDTLPALPSRPPSRARLPSLRRSLLVDLKVEGKGSDTEDTAAMGHEEMVFKASVLGNKRIANTDQPVESPYVKMAKMESCNEKCGWKSSADSASKKKFHVWCRLSDTDWEMGNVQSVNGEDAVVSLSNGNVLTVSMENILPANPDILNDVDDLIKLSYLNEPSVIHTLKCRYSRDMIYTKAGPVLVAINPFKELPIYGNDLAAAYREKKNDMPHVYSIAHSAYSEMMRDGSNQSIIISGESGAGKTETAKIAIQYLAALGGGSGIENEVLQTNFVLEAFGNAKTARNDNSSRYGKLIEMHFNEGGKLCGAKIETLLLEKTRVVQREKGERSYHVFYQLCAGAPRLLKEKLNLKAADEYEYLKQSDCLRITGVDDAQRFHMLMEALDTVHICKEDQENVFAMLAAVLWLGNIAFQVTDGENHVEVVTNEGVTSAAKLMGCKVSELKSVLSTCKFHVGNDIVIEKLTLSQATDTRDALAKSIYICLFDWLVEKLNKSLGVEQTPTGGSITILDIYGFECCHRNSFEQLCINYANERVQQLFNRHLFKLEQEEYIEEGIDWKNVEFIDNNECLNLFEKRPLGLLSLLDEESTLPEATDLTFINKLKQHLDGNPCFKGEIGVAFRVCHYAGEVVYDTSGFLEKNRDVLHSDSVNLLSSCDCQLSQLSASYVLNQSKDPFSPTRQLSSVASQNQSLGSKFKGQLFKLMQCLEKTTPHFIRCIKPNNKQLPGMFENDHALRQLRCCGVLDIVRISKAGYPIRITHRRFAERYGFLLLENVEAEDPLSISVSVLQRFNTLPGMYQVGYTKLFFRTGQIAALENIRNETMQGILCVQKFFRGMQARRNFQVPKKGETTLQSTVKDVGSKTHHKKVNKGLDKNHQGKDTNKECPQVQSSVFAELEMQVSKTEAALKQKEEENNKLRERLQEYERRCLENEAKMKSMEETWKTQMASLQLSLNAATGVSENSQDAAGGLAKEYEQHKQAFENDVRVLVDVKSGQAGPGANSDEDFRKLKAQFTSWKKDYKVRLRDAKSKLRKLRVPNGDKTTRRRWWITKKWKLQNIDMCCVNKKGL